MNWKKFLILCAALIALIVIFVFVFNRSSENYVERELSALQQEIEARGDGSSLIYDLVETDLEDVKLKRLIYQNGATGARLGLFDVLVETNFKDIEAIHAKRVEWINAAGTLLTLNQLVVDDIEKNPKSTHSWNQYLFGQLQGEDLSISAQAPNQDPLEFRAAQIALENLTQTELESLQMREVQMIYSPELQARLDYLIFNHIRYGKIDEIMESLEEGYIPIQTLSELGSVSFSSGGLELELDGQSIDGQNSDETETRLLQLFLDNAPPELRELLGTGDAEDIKSKIDEWEEKDSDEVAVDMLELMLQFLKENKEQN